MTPGVVLYAPQDIAIGVGWVWGRLNCGVSAQVLPNGGKSIGLGADKCLAAPA